MKKLVQQTLLIVFTFMLITPFATSQEVWAQEISEVTVKQKYNEALEFAQNNKFEDAIQAFEEAATMAEQLGDAEIARKAREQVMKLYFDKALRLTQAKEYQAAMQAFEKAKQVAEALGDEEMIQRAQKGIAGLHYNIGRQLATQKNFEEALKHFEAAIALEPDDPKNYYMKAFVLRQMGRDQESGRLEHFKKTNPGKLSSI